MNDNIILDVDSYKVSMPWQYPEKSEYVSSYVEARGSKDPDYDVTVFMGSQYYAKRYLSQPITQADIDEAEEIFALHGEPFYKEGWQYILDKYDGYLPIKIEAVAEGTVLPLSNVLAQVVNTDPKCWWLTTWVETGLLRAIWYMTTVATNSYTIKRMFKEYYDRTGGEQGLDFKLHDFGARGVSSKESAGMGGISHLSVFRGTDTIEAIVYGRRFYNEKCAGFSIPASEHSTVTSWGRMFESKAFRNMITNPAFANYPMVACVSDSYDIYEAVAEKWGVELKEEILNSGKVLVVRPDSGDPLEVPLEVIRILMDRFGYTVNEQGYKTLPDSIRVIQGDGITKDSLKEILRNMEKAKFSLDNIAFGMGSGLLQQVNRDTLGFAMKASNIVVDGKDYDVYKEPLHGGKASKKGVLGLYYDDDGNYVTERKLDYADSLLQTVYENGEIFVNESLTDIRERVNM